MRIPDPVQITGPDEFSLDHVLNEGTSIFTEAVFAKGKKQTREIEPYIEKVQNRLKEIMAKDGKVNLEKFWKDTCWRDLEHKLQDTFGFKTIVFDLIDDNATKRGKKINLPTLNVWIQSLARFPIEAIVTDEGFYDKSRSMEAFVSVSTWFLLKLTPSEFMAVFLHEMGHGIDPALIDIRYMDTNVISEYLLDRKKPAKRETKKWMDHTKSFIGEIAFIAGFWVLYLLFLLVLLKATYPNGNNPSETIEPVPNNWFANMWSRIQRLFMGKNKYDEWVEKKYAQKLKQALDKQQKKFSKYDNAEAFADNFPRMYGYGSELVQAFQKMRDLQIKQEYKSRFKKDIERRKFITNMLYKGIMGEHGTDVQRAQQLLKEYDQDLRNPHIPEKVKKAIKEDRDQLARVTDQYLNHFDEFHNRMNKMIFDTLNEEKGRKIKKEEEVKESTSSPFVENWVIPEKNFEINLEKWGPGEPLWITGSSGDGKLEPNSTRIPTPDGWKLMGELKPGDYVFSVDGTPTRVLGVYPKGIQDIYKISFHDGRYNLCGADHMWWVYYKSHGKDVYIETDTKSMMLNYKRPNPRDMYRRYRIPLLSGAVQYTPREVSIDPYVIGAFIGNGCMKESGLTLSSGTPDVPNAISDIIDCPVRRNSSFNYSYCYYIGDGNTRVKTSEFFSEYPELVDYSYNKEIPEDYLYNSEEVRWRLLQGLMDTDGCISVCEGRYNVSYSSTSDKLMLQIQQLVRSLGFNGNITLDHRIDKYTSKFLGNMIIQIPNEYKPHLFLHCEKKVSLAEEAAKHKGRRDYTKATVKEIEFSHREEATCIRVEHPSKLYITDQFIPTHNSTLAKKLAKENKATVVSSDYVLLRANRTKDHPEQIKDGKIVLHGHVTDINGTIEYEYIKTHPGIPYGIPNGENLEAETVKFYKWFINECKKPKYKNTKFIVEGCSICSMDPELMAKKPLIIVNTSRLKSFHQRSKRNSEEKGVPLIKSYFKYLKKYNSQNKVLDDRKDRFKKDIKRETKDGKKEDG